jgi:quercetin dioxygenase-like cupin family protein
MPNLDRRTLLIGFGIASVTPLLAWQATPARRVAVCKPGESRFAFASAAQAQTSPCKVSSEDTDGACTVFELSALPRSGPFLHVHHREDEWYYVLSGEFIFRVGGEEHRLVTGGSIWLPRGVPHVWANTATTDGRLILMCQPGGFEKFFDDMGKVPMDKKSSENMRDLMAKYGMEMLGPPIFASSWMQQHS